MRRRVLIQLSAMLLVALLGGMLLAVPAAAGAGGAAGGSFALSGQAARDFKLPADMVEVRSWTDARGRTTTRYQQVVDKASVVGAQITLTRDANGAIVAAIGAYYPALEAKNRATLTRADARAIVARELGRAGQWRTTLRLDPASARLFYEVQSLRSDSRPVRWIDAGNGAVRKSFDAIAEDHGIGVKGDTKSVDSTPAGGGFELVSPDGRRATYDAGNRTVRGTIMVDADDHWTFTKPTYTSPDQRPGVDAHYYADVVDDFYGSTFGRNSIDDEGMQIISTVHFFNRYCNAFWNGIQMTYGDGDGGKTCLPLSGGLDVVGHELTHGVTEFTSNLIYENESGANNEAFSDMMGNTIEFYAQQTGRDPAGEPDWLIGEDVITSPDTFPGFRNMGDPQEDGDPDHYSEFIVTGADNGGVHSNSAIPNHAYYLAVNGGRNAGCDAVGSNGHTHTLDCDVVVEAVGLARAAQIFYDGYTSLTEFGNICDARNATVAQAGGDRFDISDAWAAVGVHAGCTPGVPPPPPCVGDDTASIPFETPHPYGNNGDCTWTYDNGTPGFAFHFSLLDTEADFDFVFIRDGNGTLLAVYDGTFRRGVTTPCIGTSVGSVQFTSDGSVVAQGFIVDAVVPC